MTITPIESIAELNAFIAARNARLAEQELPSVSSIPDQPWRHKDTWSMRGKDFMVQVTRHGEQISEERLYWEGPHRWCVYAYIYPKHPLFGKFEGDHLWQDATSNLPLHGGCSFLQYHRNEKSVVTAVQVGCDYNHLHDESFTFYATKEAAYGVFSDAENLFASLTRATL